jgi:hypothetical protein
VSTTPDKNSKKRAFEDAFPQQSPTLFCSLVASERPVISTPDKHASGRSVPVITEPKAQTSDRSLMMSMVSAIESSSAAMAMVLPGESSYAHKTRCLRMPELLYF